MIEYRKQRCTAKISKGTRQCERWAINGGLVCATHGGRAPQVKRSAKEKLEELIEPALKGLNKALKSNDLNAIVRSAQIVLDRTGFYPAKIQEGKDKDLDNMKEKLAEAVGVDSKELPN